MQTNMGEPVFLQFSAKLSRTVRSSMLLSGLAGLIPNCAASVVVTQLYLEGLMSTGAMLAGLLVGAGVGILVLFKENLHPKENIKIVLLLYTIGTVAGIIIECIGLQI